MAKDDLEAVKTVAAALEGFDPADQERIIRWAREKVGLSAAPPISASGQVAQPHIGIAAPEVRPSDGRDLKTFVNDKNPQNDVQFAATIAYFFRFEAPVAEQKDEINSQDLQDACRLAGRHRLKKPDQTLRNAKSVGLLDGGSKPGLFTINSVGENLVAMTLPSGAKKTQKRAKTKKPTKKSAKKKK